MKKISIWTTSGMVLSIVCLLLTHYGYTIAAAGVGLAGYFLAFQGVGKETDRWQLIAFIIIGSIFGYALSPHGGSYSLAVSMLFFSLFGAVRLVFFERLGYVNSQWLELVLVTVALGYYVFGNIYDGLGWISWVFPIPAVAWYLFRLVGTVVDIKELKVLIKHKYGVQPGSTAPSFSLPDEGGNKVNLSDYKGKKHVLLIFVKGDWCPGCHIMLRTYERYKDKFSGKGIIVLAIGPDPVGVNRDMVQRLGLDYKVLSDDKCEAAKAYGMMLLGNNPMTKYEVGYPLPASFLIDINGKVVYTSNPHIPGEILTPQTIFPIVEKLQVA